MSDQSRAAPPVTPRVLTYLAVPTDDKGLAEAASSCEQNLRWAQQDEKATQKDWRAYQNLMQLTGILKTAGIKNACSVWEHVVEFVEMQELAQSELPPLKSQRTSFTTAQELLATKPHSKQSPSPASASAKAEPCAGASPGKSGQTLPLTSAQIELINANREQAQARKQAKLQQEGVDAAHAAAAVALVDPRPGRVPWSRYLHAFQLVLTDAMASENRLSF